MERRYDKPLIEDTGETLSSGEKKKSVRLLTTTTASQDGNMVEVPIEKIEDVTFDYTLKLNEKRINELTDNIIPEIKEAPDTLI